MSVSPRSSQAGLEALAFGLVPPLFAAEIQAALVEVEKELELMSTSANPLALEASRYIFEKKGKRLRPALVLLAEMLFGSRRAEDVRVASLVELLHAASLVHDDIVDRAETRRGRQTVHARWGPNVTVLLGDYLYIRTIGLALGSAHERVIGILTGVSERMIEGELDEYAASGNTLSEERYLDIITKKTASLFEACARLGAVLAGAAPQQEEALAAFGLNLGLAFQVRDDLLDLVGDEKELGKPVLSDISEGRMTLPLIHAAGSRDARARESVLGLFGRKAISRPDRVALLEALERTGSLSYASDRARDYARRAVGCLAGFPDSPAKKMLTAIADFVVSRNC
jgi:octaprenyl-diphosphate synthase